MNCYYVHYEVKRLRQHMRMIHPVEAESADEAIKLCKAARPGSYDHRVNESRQGRPRPSGVIGDIMTRENR